VTVAGTEDEQHLVFTASHDGGDTFSTPVTVSEKGASVKAHGETLPVLRRLPRRRMRSGQQVKDDAPAQIVFARTLCRSIAPHPWS
jgi:hypothetical protein